jgi:hypothetical protein
MINVDKTGLSMSWKTAVAIAGAIVMGMLAWNTFSASLARSSDLKAHDTSEVAHTDHPKHADRIHKTEVVEMIKPLKEQVESTAETVVTVQNGYYDQRAEDLAFKAVEKMPRAAPSRQRIERFERVKRKAKANLKAKRDIREGIDDPLF